MFRFAVDVDPPTREGADVEIVKVGTTVKFLHTEEPSNEAVRTSGIAVETGFAESVAVPL